MHHIWEGICSQVACHAFLVGVSASTEHDVPSKILLIFFTQCHEPPQCSEPLRPTLQVLHTHSRSENHWGFECYCENEFSRGLKKGEVFACQPPTIALYSSRVFTFQSDQGDLLLGFPQYSLVTIWSPTIFMWYIDASCLLKERNYTPGAEQRNNLNRDWTCDLR